MTKNDDALRKTLTDLGTGVEGVGVYLQVSFKELSYSYVGRVNYSLDGVVNMSFIYNNGMVEHDHIKRPCRVIWRTRRKRSPEPQGTPSSALAIPFERTQNHGPRRSWDGPAALGRSPDAI